MGSSDLPLQSALSGSTTTSSRYRTRRELLFAWTEIFDNTSVVDPVHLVRKNLVGCVTPLSFELRSDCVYDTIPQYLCCPSWCCHISFAASHPVLKAIKNRYWPVWFMVWVFLGRRPFSLTAICSTNFRAENWSPGLSTWVRNPQWSCL